MESGLRAILDSDVLIDFLQGQAKAEQELRRYAEWEISVITWMEVLSGAEGREEEKESRRFLDSLKVHPLSTGVAEEAVQLRKKFRLRLPDAVIWATARTEGCLLVTRNHRHFPKDDPGIRVPYDLD
ncbi:MAG: type II toxin-antitoxin system VapC family toxin [Verrucomicrobia bacterium]|nr:type II toxin-antitoxin system VapC family toxin [bacterium]NDD57531.1 type II toxin-antitoxin system VapC family toxin [Verrucomicrobiota bacterium]